MVLRSPTDRGDDPSDAIAGLKGVSVPGEPPRVAVGLLTGSTIPAQGTRPAARAGDTSWTAMAKGTLLTDGMVNGGGSAAFRRENSNEKLRASLHRSPAPERSTCVDNERYMERAVRPKWIRVNMYRMASQTAAFCRCRGPRRTSPNMGHRIASLGRGGGGGVGGEGGSGGRDGGCEDKVEGAEEAETEEEEAEGKGDDSSCRRLFGQSNNNFSYSLWAVSRCLTRAAWARREGYRSRVRT